MKYFWDIDKIRSLVPNCINFTEVLFELNIPDREIIQKL